MQPKILQEYDPDTMEVKLCKECKGLGVVTNPEYGVKEICSACHGQGRIVVLKQEKTYLLETFNYGQHELQINFLREETE